MCHLPGGWGWGGEAGERDGGGGGEEEEGPSRVVGGGAGAWVMGLVPLAVTSTKLQEIILWYQFGHHH